MQKSKLRLTLAILFLLSFMVSCSDKDDTEPQQNQTTEAPSLETKTVELPQTMQESTNEGAQEAVSYVSLANAFSGWAGMMTPPTKSGDFKSTQDGEPWVYTWEINEGGDAYSITLTIYETLTQYEWTMIINGTLDGYVLTDFLYMEASQTLDGLSGEFNMYDPGQSGESMLVNWSTDDNGVYTLNIEMVGDIKISITSNPDGSGEIMVYEWYETQYLLEFRAIWDNAGHGEYWEYYEGELSDHGIF